VGPMRTSDDFGWIRAAYPVWFDNGYCATLVRADPEAVLAALGGGYARRTVVGVGSGLGFIAVHDYDVDLEVEQAFGVTAVAGDGGCWTLLAQSESSFIGIDDKPMIEVLGERFEVVSHSVGSSGYGQFKWWRDGRRQIMFEPLLAPHTLSSENLPEYAGSGRDTVVELVRLTGGIQVEATDTTSENSLVEGAFALAEALTGVHLTREVLDTAVFTLSVIAIRPGARWDRPQ